MNTYLIIYNELDSSEILEDRIKRIGSYYRVFDTCWFVRSENLTAKDIYDNIIGEDLSIQNILVVYINDIGGYWGFLKKDIWEWLNNKENTDDLVQYPARVIESLYIERTSLQKTIEELNWKINSLQNTIYKNNLSQETNTQQNEDKVHS